MNTKKQQKSLELQHDALYEYIADRIKDIDRVVIGAGAGLSASAGLNYSDEIFFRKTYVPFLKAGYRTINDGITKNWYLTEENALNFWGFWAHHINSVYYSQKQLPTYDILYDIIKDKKHFVITTNADGQFFKGHFNKDKLFAMQGSYGRFQCQRACDETLYENESMIKDMLRGFNEETLTIDPKTVPRCQKCHGLLSPNLRIDHLFVEGTSMDNREAYVSFINETKEKILLLELGVGYNTPGIIRYPFDELSRVCDNVSLIRVNLGMDRKSRIGSEKVMYVNKDIHELLLGVSKLLKERSND